MSAMPHFDLCKAVAEKVACKAWVTLYEYQSYATDEFPDVLSFGNRGTTLYEIKTSHSDFIADARKDARKKWRPKVGLYSDKSDFYVRAHHPDLYYIERPHLGGARYFVCEPGVIEKTEVPEGWGLIYFRAGRMFRRVESKHWRADVRQERNILAHAFRKYSSGDSRGIIVNTYATAAAGGKSDADT